MRTRNLKREQDNPCRVQEFWGVCQHKKLTPLDGDFEVLVQRVAAIDKYLGENMPGYEPHAAIVWSQAKLLLKAETDRATKLEQHKRAEAERTAKLEQDKLLVSQLIAYLVPQD